MHNFGSAAQHGDEDDDGSIVYEIMTQNLSLTLILPLRVTLQLLIGINPMLYGPIIMLQYV